MLIAKQKTYKTARRSIGNGDIIACHYRGGFWSLVRRITGSKISHVGIAVWLGQGLYVAEMQQGGNILRPLSQTTSDFTVYKNPVSANKTKSVTLTVLRQRIRYAFLNLLLIGFNHLLHLRISNSSRAKATCGTFVRRILVRSGWHPGNLPKNPSPAQLVKQLQPKFFIQQRGQHHAR